jgi:hypothetical protein
VRLAFTWLPQWPTAAEHFHYREILTLGDANGGLVIQWNEGEVICAHAGGKMLGTYRDLGSAKAAVEARVRAEFMER